jgi:hypothetical protein
MDDRGVTSDLATHSGRLRDTAAIVLIGVGVFGAIGVTFTVDMRAGLILGFSILAVIGVALGWTE